MSLRARVCFDDNLTDTTADINLLIKVLKVFLDIDVARPRRVASTA